MQGKVPPCSSVYTPIVNMSLSSGGSLESTSWSRFSLPIKLYSTNSTMLCCFEIPFNADMLNLTISERDT